MTEKEYLMQILYEHKDHDLLLQVNHNHFLKWPLHQHYYMEVLYFLEGSLCVQYKDSDEQYQTVTIRAGELLFLFPNVPHRYFPSDDDTIPDFFGFNFSPNINERFQDIFLNNLPLQALVKKEAIHEDILFVFRKFMSSDIVLEPAEIVQTYLTLLCERLLSSLSLVKPFIPLKVLSNDESVHIINYIQKHFNEELTLDSISHATGIGKYNISRIFSSKLSTSLRTYINTLRIKYAQNQLLNTDQDITRILIDCGYQNQQTFNRIFKQACGITPTEYRSKYKSIEVFHSRNTPNGVVYYEQLSPTHHICYRQGYEPVTEPVIIPES